MVSVLEKMELDNTEPNYTLELADSNKYTDVVEKILSNMLNMENI